MNKDYELWKKIEVNGYVTEDGSDTRTEKISFYLISEEEENEFSDMRANDYGYQDYSYSVDYEKLMDFYISDLVMLKPILDKTIGEIITKDPDLYKQLENSYTEALNGLNEGINEDLNTEFESNDGWTAQP
jgi:hypothetical protein